MGGDRAGRASARPLILVVDDDISIRRVVADVLTLEGYRVATAANGQEALDAIQRDKPHLVLLDMRMPVMDGWAFVRRLRAQGSTLPVIVMSATQDAHQSASEMGADGVLAKPFDLTDLLEVIERVCAA